jgi:hypothetical protein
MPKGDRSITHLEFDYAYRRWKHLPYPPMAVYAPRPDSEADRDLRSEAEKYIPPDDAGRELHQARLENFRAEVLCAGRTAQFYKDRQELRENAIVSCLQWKGQTPLAAARGFGGGTLLSSVKDEQFGSIGRKPQYDAIADVFDQLDLESENPAVALLLAGDEDAGQRVFLSHLTQSRLLSDCRPSMPGHPPMDQYDVTVLTQWVGQALGLDQASAVQSPVELADYIGNELRVQPLYFMLDGVQRLAGRIPVFVEEFWRPLRNRLREIHATRALPSRLVAFVTDYSGGQTAPDRFLCDWDAAPDYSQLLAIPPLMPFDAKDVISWLKRMQVQDQPPGRRAQIASAVVKSAAGQVEGRPLRVFEQLRSTTLFDE